MTDKPNETEDLSTLPFLNDAERAEHDWLIARETDPDAPAPSAKAAAEYDHLEGMLRTLPEPALSDRWRDSLMQRARASKTNGPPVATGPRRAVRWGIAATGLAAAATIVLVLRAPPDGPTAPYAIMSQGGKRGGDAPGVHWGAKRAHVGDHVRSEPLSSTRRATRLYRMGETRELLAACPGGRACGRDDQFKLMLDRPGRYIFFQVMNTTQSLAAAPDDIEQFQEAAKAAGGTVQPSEIHVE